MPTIRVTVTTWRAKRGSRAIRVVLLSGMYAFRNGGVVPTLILRLCGRRGAKPLCPPERLELKQQDSVRVRADVYNGMDLEWVIENEETATVKTERELSEAIGRKAMGLIGPSAYEFLASWFPITIQKRVYRSSDGMSTVRIVNAFNKNGNDFVFIATKRSGYPEAFKTYAVGPGLSRTAIMNPDHIRAYTDISERRFTDCEDEANFRAAFGRPLLAWISQANYARLVRNGNKSDVKPADYWDDGYDLGGNGAAPVAPATPNPVLSQSRAEPGPSRAADAPRLVPINATTTRSDDVQVVGKDDYEDDPLFGSY